jgi:hypothetical protein
MATLCGRLATIDDIKLLKSHKAMLVRAKGSFEGASNESFPTWCLDQIN